MTDEAPLPVDSPESTAVHRRRLAFLALAVNCLLIAVIALREQDFGEHASEVLAWISIWNGIAMLGSIGFKAWETLALLKGRKA